MLGRAVGSLGQGVARVSVGFFTLKRYFHRMQGNSIRNSIRKHLSAKDLIGFDSICPRKEEEDNRVSYASICMEKRCLLSSSHSQHSSSWEPEEPRLWAHSDSTSPASPPRLHTGAPGTSSLVCITQQQGPLATGPSCDGARHITHGVSSGTQPSGSNKGCTGSVPHLPLGRTLAERGLL